MKRLESIIQELLFKGERTDKIGKLKIYKLKDAYLVSDYPREDEHHTFALFYGDYGYAMALKFAEMWNEVLKEEEQAQD